MTVNCMRNPKICVYDAGMALKLLLFKNKENEGKHDKIHTQHLKHRLNFQIQLKSLF